MLSKRLPKSLQTLQHHLNGWLLLPGGIGLALFLWHWKLMLALSMGSAVMILAYYLQQHNWSNLALRLRRWVNGSQRLVVVSAGSGIVVALGAYLTACVWVESNNPWIASGFLLQGLGSFAVFLLVLIQWLSRQEARQESTLEAAIITLTDSDPLKRLLGIRQIDRLLLKSHLDAAQLKLVTGSLQILVKQESEGAVRNAALDSLQSLRMTGSGR